MVNGYHQRRPVEIFGTSALERAASDLKGASVTPLLEGSVARNSAVPHRA